MTIYELYINDILCDLSSDSYVSLIYQSPLFSELDIIQSNRSQNIDLPLTPTNRRAIKHADRPDINSDAPYVKLPAALYQDGVPVFTSGYAVITEISDVISIVLTWGNVDNFQPLFDANMRDLSEAIHALGFSSIEWNANSKIREVSSLDDSVAVDFIGVNFGKGLLDPRYIHPSVTIKYLLHAIELHNGITIEGIERLWDNRSLLPFIPLSSKNGDKVSNEAEALIATPSFNASGYMLATNKTQDPRNIAGSDLNFAVFPNKNGAGTLNLNLSDAGEYFTITQTASSDISTLSLYLRLNKLNNSDNQLILLGNSYHKETSDGRDIFYFNPIDKKVNIVEYDYAMLYITPSNYSISIGISTTGQVTLYLNWNDIVFPTIFPVAANLPDMSQGEFISALMAMNGLFAYADINEPNKIKLISADEIYTNLRNGNIVDWSGKIILNNAHDVSIPELSSFTLDDLAQNNTLDYDNDDEVQTDTSGVITIRNKNIEKEAELVNLPFSASENTYTDGVNCALVPIYDKEGNFSEVTSRILTWRNDQYLNGVAICTGRFEEWMKFGGEEGIVKTKYTIFQKIVDRLRIITTRARLTTLDRLELDFSKPIYNPQLGHSYAIYSIEVAEDDICECKLIQLPVNIEQEYYLTINGGSGDINITVEAEGGEYTFSYATNGTPKIDIPSVMFGFVTIEDGIINVSIKANTNHSEIRGTLNVYLEEEPNVQVAITFIQDALPYESRNLVLDFSVLDENDKLIEDAEVLVFYTDKFGEESTYGLRQGRVQATVPDVTTDAFQLGIAAARDGYDAYENIIQVPASSDDYTYTTDVKLIPVAAASRPVNFRVSILDENGNPFTADRTQIFWQGADGTRKFRGFTYFSVINTVLEEASLEAFNVEVLVTDADYPDSTTEIPIPAGTEEYSWEGSITLRNSSRNLVLNLSIQNAEGAAVDAQSVEVRYTKPDGTEGTLTTSGSHITDTIPNVTTAYFTATITVQTDGYQLWRGPVSVPAGTDDATVEKTVTLTGSTQSRPLKLHVQVAGSDGTPLVADEVTASYIQPSGTSKQEHWANTGEVDVTLEASTGHMTMGLAALKSGYESGKKLLDIPAGSTQYDIDETLTLTSSEPTPKRRLILQLAFENLNGDAVAVDKVTVSTKDAAGGTMTREYTNVTAVNDTLDDIPTSDSSVIVTAVKSGFTDVRMTRPIPAGESDYTYTDTITIGAERLFSAELHVTDKAGQPVVADEITFTWLNSTGTTNTERRENTSSLTYGPVSNCTAEAFTMNITAKAAGYNSIEDHIDVPAGTEAYTAQKTIQLAPGSRNAVLNFTVSDKDGAPISGVGVGFRYVNADGEEDSYMADTDASGRISATIDNATIQSFDALVIAYLDGWRLYMREFAVEAGTEDYTYDRNVTLYDSYDPLVTFSKELPWTAGAHMISMHNSGNVALTLVSMPAWCRSAAKLPFDMPIDGGTALAVQNNASGSARTGTMAMEYHNTETGETVAYNVDVTQEG